MASPERRIHAYYERSRRRSLWRVGILPGQAAIASPETTTGGLPPGTIGGMMTDTDTTTRLTAAARAVGATKAYGSGDTAVRALDDVSVAFPSGRFTAIMGPSGSGKSTLM